MRLLRRLALLIAAAVVLAVPAAAGAEGWGGGPGFGTAADTQGGDVAAGTDGSLTAWWRSTGHTLTVQHARPGVALATPVALGASMETVAAAVSADGTSAVAWVPYDESAVKLTVLDPSGALVRTVDVASLAALDPEAGLGLAVAIDNTNNVTVAWQAKDPGDGSYPVRAAHVTAAGGVGAPVLLGHEDLLGGTDVVLGAAAAPNGTAWVVWSTGDHLFSGARLAADGTVDQAGAQLSGVQAMRAPRVVASAAGAAVVWPTPNDPLIPTYDLTGVRLPLSGPVAAGGFRTVGVASGWVTFPGAATSYSAVIAPDGTVTIAGQDITPPAEEVWLARFPPNVAAADRRMLREPAATYAFSPALGIGADGTVLATWVESSPPAGPKAYVAQRVTPGGTFGPHELVFSITDPVFPFATTVPGAIAVGHSENGSPWRIDTYKYDATPVVAEPVGGGGTAPPSVLKPGTPGPAPAATLAAAGLKVTKATRKGSKVTVSGTISAKANGLKVTVAYAVKVGKRALTIRRSAVVRKGRWTVRLTLSTKLRHAKGRATVTATFVGTKAIRKATAKRSVRR